MSVEMRRIAVLLVVSDHFRCFRSSSSKQTENVSSFWSSSRMVLMFETRFLPLLHLCEVSENCFIRLGHDWNNFYENIDLFQKRSLYVPVWLSWFRCIYLTWTRNIERYGKVFAPLLLIAFHWQIFFFSVFFCSCVPFFHLLLFRFSQLCLIW